MATKDTPSMIGGKQQQENEKIMPPLLFVGCPIGCGFKTKNEFWIVAIAYYGVYMSTKTQKSIPAKIWEFSEDLVKIKPFVQKLEPKYWTGRPR